MVPVDILQKTLRSFLEKGNRGSNYKNTLEPLSSRQLASVSRSPFLPGLNLAMPPLWSNQAIQSMASTKNDEAETVMNLWNLRIIPLFPGCTEKHLNTLRTFFRVYDRRILLSYFSYLRERHKLCYMHYLQERGCLNKDGGI